MSSSQRLIGQTIGKYKIVELLGRGGMAEVYKAYQETLDRHVAIKLMHAFLADEEDFLSRFQREARAMAALSHTNIVSVYDFDVQDGTYYIVMEFVSGGTLKQSLEGLATLGERLPLSHTVQIILEIADALAYAHNRGMVHRDIKPANIMLNEEGRAVLTDFGIAKILSGPSFTATGAMIGTPAYMSPEQGLGQTGDERSDLYALGVLFFQMATGRLPYDADTPLAVILKHVNEPIPELSSLDVEIPEAIHQVILKAMAKDPEERYQTAHRMANDLRAAVRVSNMEMGTAIPSELLQDKPTPPPMRTVPAAKQGGFTPTMLPKSSPPPIIETGGGSTRIGSPNLIEQTDISTPVPEKKRSSLPLIVAVVVVLLLIGGVVGGLALANRGSDDGTPTGQQAVADGATATPGPPTEPAVSSTEEADSAPQETAEFRETEAAAVALLTNQPTDTPLPTRTTAPTPTPAPNMTATFLASCEVEIELLDYYTFQNGIQSAPVNSEFTMNWVIVNNGDCPVTAETNWAYVEGEQFGQDGPVIFEIALPPGSQVTLSTPLQAPAQPGLYESTWQLIDADGNPLGEPITFEIGVYPPATAVPTPTQTPAATNAPTATATPATTEPLRFQTSVSNCTYEGGDWRCQLNIIVIGGLGPYTVIISEDPPAQYNGSGPFSHLMQVVRCHAWVHNVLVQDDTTGQSYDEDVFVSPNDHFEGGCTLPQ